MTDFEERRRHRRYDIENVKGFLTLSLDVKILNMSVEGMAVESRRMLGINKDYTIRVNHKGETLDLEGTVLWSTLSRTVKLPDGDIVPVYRAGIKFKNVLKDNALSLVRFIEDNRVLTLEKRILGRFNVGTKDAHINFPFNFKARRISLSGMLIESEMPLEVNSSYEMILNLNDDREVSLTGKVANLLEPEADDPLYKIGIEFISLKKADRKALRDYIDSLCSNGGRKRD